MSYGCGIIILKYTLNSVGKWSKNGLRLRLSYYFDSVLKVKNNF